MKKQIFVSLRHSTTSLMALLIFLCCCQYRATGQMLNPDGALHIVGTPGEKYIDFTIPEPCPYAYLYLSAKGGDGGWMRTRDFVGNVTASGRGGIGATAQAYFKIGTGKFELKPGSRIRMIIGRKGADKTVSVGTYQGGGGGGGTGVLYLPKGWDPTKPQNWSILAVAGGGGGGYADWVNGHYDGRPGTSGTIVDHPGSQSDKYHDYYDGYRKSRDLSFSELVNTQQIGGISDDNNGAGGGAGFLLKNDAGIPLAFDGSSPNKDLAGNAQAWYQTSFNKGGKGGFQPVDTTAQPVGGSGGHTNGGRSGGWGFGGGGCGYDLGGGGGGYAGGWPGYKARAFSSDSHYYGGGGGSSFVNDDLILPNTKNIISQGTTSSPKHGLVHYQLTNDPKLPVFRALRTNEHLRSNSNTGLLIKNRSFELWWQGDGNLVLRDRRITNKDSAIWASGAKGAGSTLVLQSDGNIVIYNNGAAWDSGTYDSRFGGKGGHDLQLNSDGNLKIIDADGKELWATHTHY